MSAFFFVRGYVIGLAIAAVVGPISVLCIQRTLARGWRYGAISGMGVATADGLYAALAAFGVTAISGLLLSIQFWARLIGGAFLIYLGVKAILAQPAKEAASAATRKGLPGAYLSILLLTLANPLTILSFAAVFVGLGVGLGQHTPLAAALVVVGVALGSASWWLLLTGGVSLLRARLTPRWLTWINRIAGCGILAFGLWAVIGLVSFIR